MLSLPRRTARNKKLGAIKMAELKFAVIGKDHKALVSAISEFLNIPSKYLGAPNFQYQIGDILINKEGTATGEFLPELLTALSEQGFTPETEEEVAKIAKINRLTIEYPLDNFSPEKLEILIKLVKSKAVLIKKALGTEELPIAITESSIKFAWFPGNLDGEMVHAYSQFVAALCETAKIKSRVTAQPQAFYENEKFAIHVFFTALGLTGEQYKLCRKLLMQNLSGNSGHRFVKPKNGTHSRKRDGVRREILSIRLTPDTIEKLNSLASQSETETGQRTSRNMLIERVIEAYIATNCENTAPTSIPLQEEAE